MTDALLEKAMAAAGMCVYYVHLMYTTSISIYILHCIHIIFAMWFKNLCNIHLISATCYILHIYIYTEEAAKLTNKKDGVDGEEGGDKNKDTKDNKKEDNFKFRKETVEDEEVKIHPDTCKY